MLVICVCVVGFLSIQLLRIHTRPMFLWNVHTTRCWRGRFHLHACLLQLTYQRLDKWYASGTCSKNSLNVTCICSCC